MGADLITAIHKVPAPAPTATDVVIGMLDAYKAIIDAATPQQIAEAITLDHYFGVDDFGVDDDEFHDGVPAAITQIAGSAEAVAAARSHLYETAETYAVGRCNARADLCIGGIQVALYGGMSWGDEPFDGFGAVCALSYLPGLGVESTASVEPWLSDRVLGSLTDFSGLDTELVRWIATHPAQVRGLVESEVGARESVIADVIDSVLSDLEAEVRSAVHAEVAARVGR